jgi:hypothetical protein
MNHFLLEAITSRIGPKADKTDCKEFVKQSLAEVEENKDAIRDAFRGCKTTKFNLSNNENDPSKHQSTAKYSEKNNLESKIQLTENKPNIENELSKHQTITEYPVKLKENKSNDENRLTKHQTIADYPENIDREANIQLREIKDKIIAECNLQVEEEKELPKLLEDQKLLKTGEILPKCYEIQITKNGAIGDEKKQNEQPSLKSNILRELEKRANPNTKEAWRTRKMLENVLSSLN